MSESIIDENERTNSSKSFSVKSLRLPRGALGVIGWSSSSIFAGIEDVCNLGTHIFIRIDELRRLNIVYTNYINYINKIYLYIYIHIYQ